MSSGQRPVHIEAHAAADSTNLPVMSEAAPRADRPQMPRPRSSPRSRNIVGVMVSRSTLHARNRPGGAELAATGPFDGAGMAPGLSCRIHKKNTLQRNTQDRLRLRQRTGSELKFTGPFRASPPRPRRLAVYGFTCLGIPGNDWMNESRTAPPQAVMPRTA